MSLAKVVGLLIVVGGLGNHALAQGSELGHVVIKGSAQFWQRDCTPDGSCGLPQPLSDKIVLSGEVTEPATADQLGTWSQTVTSGALSAQIQIFWRKADALTVGYLVQQTRLTENGAVAECTSYNGIPSTAFMAVGACSGFSDGGRRQIGISFSKN